MDLFVGDVENVSLTGEDGVKFGLFGAFLFEIQLGQSCVAVD